MDVLVPLILQVVCGGASGAVVGNLLRQTDMGTIQRILSGIVGGVGAGTAFTAFADPGFAIAGVGMNSAIASVVGGAAGGGALTAALGSVMGKLK